MLLSDVLRYAFKAMSERRFRALLTIVGIAIGPLALVMMTGVVRGYSAFVENQLLSLGQNTVVLMSSAEYTLKEDDLDFVRSLDEVSKAEPFYLTSAFILTPEGRLQVYVYAMDIEVLLESVGGLEVLKGSYPLPNEPLYAIVGYRVAYSEKTGKELFDIGDTITLYIPKIEAGGVKRFERAIIRIKGVFKEYGGAMFISPDTGIFLPLSAGRKVLRFNKWTGIMAIAKSPELVSKLVKKLRDVYDGKIDIIAFQQIARVVGSITAAMDFITFSTSLSAFAVAVAGTAATMITSVIERTREIGVLKALGFTDGQVMIMILTESILMSILGAIIGISLGFVGAHVLAGRGLRIRGGLETIVIKAPPLITPELLGMTIAITLVVGVLGGLFPAYRAAKIPPVVALRYE
ncbi:MAG: ABC transporter permease [Thermoprotei archaeon]|nr:MAG: ABC transporter permease [Thermoprotei archaeon]